MAVVADAGQDLVGGLGPHVGPWVVVPGVDPGADVGVEVTYRGVGAAAQFLVGQFGEPALDQVEPGCAERPMCNPASPPVTQRNVNRPDNVQIHSTPPGAVQTGARGLSPVQLRGRLPVIPKAGQVADRCRRP